jgi:putative acetyltransferase
MDIRVDDLKGPEIVGLLEEHVRSLRAISPPESCHVLDLAGLRRPEITFWSAWQGSQLLGCAALKELDRQHGEIKSMRTASAHLRKGVASALLGHIVSEAGRRKYRRLSLETGAQAEFEPALRLYTGFGFERCRPFGNYVEDPLSVFMTRAL